MKNYNSQLGLNPPPLANKCQLADEFLGTGEGFIEVGRPKERTGQGWAYRKELFQDEISCYESGKLDQHFRRPCYSEWRKGGEGINLRECNCHSLHCSLNFS